MQDDITPLHSVVSVTNGEGPRSASQRQSNIAWRDPQGVQPAISGSLSATPLTPTRTVSGSVQVRASSSGQRPSVTGHTRVSQVRQILTASTWYHSPIAHQLRTFLHGKLFALAMIVALILALFLHDTWILCGVNSDIEIDILLTVVMIMFSFELIFLSVVDASYFLSFFFFMDIIGTISMVADISFMLGSSNIEAKSASDASAESNLMLLRATRAARVGARAGRLSRVVRMLRFLPFLMGRKHAPEEEEKRGMAKAISSQLANLLATRVACLTILLVMVIPIFDVLTFPQKDYALEAWVERLAENLSDGDLVTFGAELDEMVDFFSTHTYGPYKACKGMEHQSGASGATGFTCTQMITTFEPGFGSPPREASTLLVHTETFMVAFNMHQPVQIDALMGIMLIIFIVFIMVFSGLALSSVVNELAVRPLERMLGTVKQIASTVFKFSAQVNEDEDEDFTDVEGSSEMKLLEKVVAKLAIITDLQTRDKVQNSNLDDINDEDIGILSMMQGKNLKDEQKKAEERRESKMSTPRKFKANSGSVFAKMDDFTVGFPQENLVSWAFNTMTFTKPQKTALCIHTVVNFRDWVICYDSKEEGVLTRFVHAAEKEYKDDAMFHNFAHASDVVHAVARMMNVMCADAFLTELEQYCLLIAAIGHDLGHPGVNNGFLSEVSHELAVQYNDKSPLENMHCSKLYTIVTQEESNVFAKLNREDYKEMRKMCIETILHTDMLVHMTMVKDLQMVYQMNMEIFAVSAAQDGQLSLGEAEIFSATETKMLTMDCLLHSSDVSNPCKVWEVASGWAHRVLEEFFAQGDEEKRLGIPVQFLNDRDKLNRPNSQIGFIEFMIAPFYAAQIRLWPDLKSLGDNLGINIGNWENLWISEMCPSQEEKTKVHARCTRVQESLEEAKSRGLLQ